jgi:GT2 family glycosyltransferase
MEAQLPTFDLIVATIGRTVELAALLDSLTKQSHPALRVVVVDQNDDERLAPVLGRYEQALTVERLHSSPGLSRARNAGLAIVAADLVAFPDDDCSYPPDLLERVARRFAEQPALEGLTGRTAAADGSASARWGAGRAVVTRANVWHAGNSASTFLRASIVRRIGPFDEALGLGSRTPASSGEEVDYLVRAVSAGARVEYDPTVVVTHALPQPDATRLAALGRRDGAGVGYILGKHRYPRHTVALLLLRPLGGALVSLARRDVARAHFHVATLRGRLEGFRAGRAA